LEVIRNVVDFRVKALPGFNIWLVLVGLSVVVIVIKITRRKKK